MSFHFLHMLYWQGCVMPTSTMDLLGAKIRMGVQGKDVNV